MCEPGLDGLADKFYRWKFAIHHMTDARPHQDVKTFKNGGNKWRVYRGGDGEMLNGGT